MVQPQYFQAKVANFSWFAHTPDEARRALRSHLVQLGEDWNVGHLPITITPIVVGRQPEFIECVCADR